MLRGFKRACSAIALSAAGSGQGGWLGKSAVRAICGSLLLLGASGARAWPDTEQPFSPYFMTPPTSQLEQGSDSDATAFYAEQVDPGVQQECLACHKAGGAAPSDAEWNAPAPGSEAGRRACAGAYAPITDAS